MTVIVLSVYLIYLTLLLQKFTIQCENLKQDIVVSAFIIIYYKYLSVIQ